MKTYYLAALIGLAATSFSVLADTPQEANLKKAVAQHLGQGAVIDSVKKTPYAGLYEVRVGGDLFYTDEQAKYIFAGHILDGKSSRDLTKERLDDINRIKFSDLPFDSAIKTVKGDGQRVIAVFEDPNCGYCKRFRQTLQGVNNVTVYTFLYNILSDESSVKSKNIWCTGERDRAKAWDDWMLNGKAATEAPAACTTPNEKVFALGQKLHITGTPTIFFVDGSRVPGALDGKGLESKFATLKTTPAVQ
ncbi:MAG: DsbC family protein [Pseudomonadota bacterium]|nr:DsbC family protein [Pseudomonadota bacterium]